MHFKLKAAFVVLCIFLIFGSFLTSSAQELQPTEETSPPVIVETQAPPTEENTPEPPPTETSEPPETTEIPTVEPTVETTPEPTLEPTLEPTSETTSEPTAEVTGEPTIEPTLPVDEAPVFYFNQTQYDALAGIPLEIIFQVSDDKGMVRVVEDASATLGGLSLTTSEPVETTPPFITNVTVTYLAPADYTGSDSFTLTAIDASGQTVAVTITVNIGAEATAEAAPALTQEPGDYAIGESVDVVGYISVVWADPQDKNRDAEIIALFTDPQENIIQLEIDDDLALELDGQQVHLSGEVVDMLGESAPEGVQNTTSAFPTTPVINVNDITAVGEDGVMADIPGLPSGEKRWITLFCRFPDIGATPTGFNSSYITNLMRNTYPGLNHYWNEVSNGHINIDNSVVHSTVYTLPSSLSSYSNGQSNGVQSGVMFNDCVALADSAVDFSQFYGINILVNAEYGFPNAFALGGGVNRTLDGVTKRWATTWMPPFGLRDHGVFAHEMGHAYGLPHSGGPYGQAYDSRWDVMSGGNQVYCPAAYQSQFNCLGTGTIAYHADELGFIPADRKVTVDVGTSATVVLQALGQGTSGADDLMISIPIGATGTFYTVELRRFAGSYDVSGNLPGEAVIIHKVNNNNPNDPRHAQVVDPDNNGDPNDGSARWLVGETFIDSTNQIRVKILSQTSTTFTVQVFNGVASGSMVVNSTADDADDNIGDGLCATASSVCTLRAAIQEANFIEDTTEIEFNIGTGSAMIQPLSALPAITNPISIDGTSQPGYAGTPLIEINGQSTSGSSGLQITASAAGSSVKGLVINRFQIGIELNGGNANTIQNNYIGTNVAGTAALPNTTYGIYINNSSSNIIGGSGAGNLVSGNGSDGIYLTTNSGANGNSVTYNRIGTNAAATALIGNTGNGIASAMSNTTIGNNTIAGNGGDGVNISGNSIVGNRITRNQIYSNTGLGIDLMPNGVTPNDTSGTPDADTGPNTLQNYPTLASASLNGSTATISVTPFWSTPNSSFTLEFFGSSTCDSTNFGEGEIYIFTPSNPLATGASGGVGVTYTSTSSLYSNQAIQYLTVTVTNSGNSTSEFSNCVPLIRMGIPSGLTATPTSDTQINLTWVDNATNETGYRVERSPLNANTWTEIAQLAANSTSYSDTSLTCNTGYSYRVRGHRSTDGAFSQYSNVANGTTQACSIPAPSNMQASTVSATQIDLTWTDNTADETEFRVERSPAGVNTWTQIGVVAADTTAYSSTGLTCNTGYDYRVRAFRSAGNALSSTSNVANATTQACPPPNAPTTLNAAAISNAQINLIWTDNAADETGYRVERSPAGANTWTEIAQLTANVTSYNNTGLTCETGYDYQVRAFRSSGGNNFSTYSNTATATTTACPPATPTNLTVSAASDTQINLTWTDNAADETEYRVERSPNGTNWTQIAVLAANSQSYSNTGLACNTSYQYRVSGYRSGDGLSSGYSNTATVSTLGCPLLPPTSFTGVAVSSSQIDLNWSLGTGADYTMVEWGSNNATVSGNSYSATFLNACTNYDFRARSYRLSDDAFSAYTDTITLMTQCLPVAGTPVLTLPANAASTNDVTPTFEWQTNGVANAQEYDIQIATDSGFTNVILVGTSSSNSFTSSQPINGGTNGAYFWRVRGANVSDDGSWSSAFRFTLDTEAPLPPALLTLAKGSFTADSTPAFTWTRITDAPKYELLLSTNPDCATPVYTSPQVTTTSFTVPNANALTSENIYFWCVRSLDAAGNASVLSNAFDFAFTLLKLPLNASATVDNTPTFSWNTAGVGATYQLIVSPNEDLSNPVIDQSGITATTFTPTTAIPSSGLYYWRVIVTGGIWNVTEPIVWSFLLNSIKPAAPLFVSPVKAGATNDTTPVIDWQSVPEISGVDITYEFWFDDNSLFSSPLIVDALTDSTYEVTPALPETSGKAYYARVRAVYSDVVIGPWSATLDFKLDTVAPSAPALKMPLDSSFTMDTTPLFSWMPTIAESKRYMVNISTAGDCSNPFFTSAEVLTASFTLPNANALPAEDIYSWCVRAADAAGNWSGWSSAWRFELTLLKLPVSSSVTTDTTPTFTWNRVLGTGVTYGLVVSTNPDLSSPVINLAGLTTTSFTPTTALPAGDTYYWRVIVNGAWSVTDPSVWSLLILPIRPVAPALVAPLIGSATNDTTPLIDWNPVTDVPGVTITYEVWVDDLSSFASPQKSNNPISATDYTVDPALPNTPGTRYYARVRAVYDGVVFGPWSSVRNFMLDTQAPSQPQLLLPANAATTSSKRPAFSWKAAATGLRSDAVRYEFFLDGTKRQDGRTLTYLPTSDLASGAHTWYVIAYDAAGNSAASATFTLTVTGSSQLCSTGGGSSASVQFVNNSSVAVNVYWVNFSCQEVLYRTLQPGASYTQGTFVNHPWRVRNVQTGAVMGEFNTSGNMTYTIN
jgi:M6 family metalloprotease-like protein/CSLREA domain-containing protein